MARPAQVSPSPAIQPLLFEGTSGKGGSEDLLRYVPKSALAATLPALLCILRALGHLQVLLTKALEINLVKVFGPLQATGVTISIWEGSFEIHNF